MREKKLGTNTSGFKKSFTPKKLQAPERFWLGITFLGEEKGYVKNFGYKNVLVANFFCHTKRFWSKENFVGPKNLGPKIICIKKITNPKNLFQKQFF